MSNIGLSVWQSDIIILLYVVLLVVSLILLFRRKLLINQVGIVEILISAILVTLTFTFVRTYSRSERKYLEIWRLIHRELIHIRKTYGVMEIRLVFHFLIKQVQVKSFYGDAIDPELGIDVIRLVELWSKLVYRDLASFNLDATYRVRVICLERAVKQGLRTSRN